MNTDEARQLLRLAGVFFDSDEPGFEQMLNLNDVFAWACADGEAVPDDKLVEVAELFKRYGQCGILYWVNRRRGGRPCEFADINRFVEFVRYEEDIRRQMAGDSRRAYHKTQYTIGGYDSEGSLKPRLGS